MSQKLTVNGVNCVKETSHKKLQWRKWWRKFSWNWCSISKKLHKLYNGLPLMLERMKIEKGEKLVENLHDKKEYVIHKTNLKQALNHWLVFDKFPDLLNSIKKLGLNYTLMLIQS